MVQQLYTENDIWGYWEHCDNCEKRWKMDFTIMMNRNYIKNLKNGHFIY